MDTDTRTKISRSHIFYGWWVALLCALSLFVGPIPIAVFSFGVFLKPLVRELHAGRGAVSFGSTLGTLMLAAGLPLAGRLIDRFGARKVILPSTLVAGLILLSITASSGRLWEFYLFYAALGLSTCGVSPVSYGHVVTHWFDRYRGLALGVTMLGLGLGALIMPSIAQVLIGHFGWRLAFGTIGAATLLITFPVLATFLKDRPEEMGLSPDGSDDAFGSSAAAYDDSGVSLTVACHDRTFWLLICSFGLVSASVQACLAHLSAILTDRGAAAQTAALATSLFGGGVLLGRTATGYLLDRFFAPHIAAAIFACAAAGIATLRMTSSQELALFAAFFIGLGLGAEVDIMAYLTSRYFGLRSFGSIYGVTFALFALAGGQGAYFMGAAFDRTGSYTSMLVLFSIATLTGALLILRLGAYRYQVRTIEPQASPVGMLPLQS